jgi:hypothetical protein
MKKTGVMVTKEDLEKIRNLAAKGWQSGVPMITFSVGEGIRRDEATVDAIKICHQLALDYGLPEIEGYYGIDFNGEFVTT